MLVRLQVFRYGKKEIDGHFPVWVWVGDKLWEVSNEGDRRRQEKTPGELNPDSRRAKANGF